MAIKPNLQLRTNNCSNNTYKYITMLQTHTHSASSISSLTDNYDNKSDFILNQVGQICNNQQTHNNVNNKPELDTNDTTA